MSISGLVQDQQRSREIAAFKQTTGPNFRLRKRPYGSLSRCVGFDDVAPATFSIPPLTTVRQPLEVMGETAADIIAGAMNVVAEKREFSSVNIRLLPELVARRSTRQAKMQG